MSLKQKRIGNVVAPATIDHVCMHACATRMDFNVSRGTVNVVHMSDSFSRGIWATPGYIWEILRTETTKRAQAEKKSDLLDFMEYGFQEIE